MSDLEDHASPTDRSKRPLEDDEAASKSDSDRHHNRAKRQAVPDPQTDTPYAAKSTNPLDTDKSDDAESKTSDRRHSKDDDEVESNVNGKQQMAETTPISLRAIVNTKDAGVIIGKGGKNVSEIRELSGAKITISEMVPGAVERILTVSGLLDTVALVS